MKKIFILTISLFFLLAAVATASAADVNGAIYDNGTCVVDGANAVDVDTNSQDSILIDVNETDSQDAWITDVNDTDPENGFIIDVNDTDPEDAFIIDVNDTVTDDTDAKASINSADSIISQDDNNDRNMFDPANPNRIHVTKEKKMLLNVKSTSIYNYGIKKDTPH